MVEELIVAVNSHNYHQKPEAWYSCALYKAAVFSLLQYAQQVLVTIWQNWQMTVRPRDFWKELAHRSRVIGGPPNHFPCMIWAGSPYNPGPMCSSENGHDQVRGVRRSSANFEQSFRQCQEPKSTVFYRRLAGTKNETVVSFVCVFIWCVYCSYMLLHVLIQFRSPQVLVPHLLRSCPSPRMRSIEAWEKTTRLWRCQLGSKEGEVQVFCSVHFLVVVRFFSMYSIMFKKFNLDVPDGSSWCSGRCWIGHCLLRIFDLNITNICILCTYTLHLTYYFCLRCTWWLIQSPCDEIHFCMAWAPSKSPLGVFQYGCFKNSAGPTQTCAVNQWKITSFWWLGLLIWSRVSPHVASGEVETSFLCGIATTMPFGGIFPELTLNSSTHWWPWRKQWWRWIITKQ